LWNGLTMAPGTADPVLWLDLRIPATRGPLRDTWSALAVLLSQALAQRIAADTSNGYWPDVIVRWVAPDHRFMDPSGVQIHARDLKLQTIVQARNCYLSVARLELCTDRDIKVGIEVEEPHVYYVDGVLSHNKVYC
jgi:hypothetical protein